MQQRAYKRARLLFLLTRLPARRTHSLVSRSQDVGRNAGILQERPWGRLVRFLKVHLFPRSRLTQSKGSTRIKKYYHIDGGKHVRIYHDEEGAGHNSQGDS